MHLRRVVTSLVGAVSAAGLLMTGVSAGNATAIVGGTQAVVNDGAVSLWTLDPVIQPQRNRCGGALIRPQWVATAAHCVEVLMGFQPVARIGLDNVTPRDATHPNGYVQVPIVAGYVYPDFNEETLPHDVALLKLERPVSSSVQKPMSFTSAPPAPGTQTRIQGWGWPCDFVAPPQCTQGTFGVVKQLNLIVKQDSACASLWYPDHEHCVAAASGKNEMGCFGDSGVPEYVKGLNDDRRLLGMLIYDGDDWSAASCSSAPDGSQGLGVVVDIRPHLPWMTGVMSGLEMPGAVRVLTVPGAPAAAWLN